MQLEASTAAIDMLLLVPTMQRAPGAETARIIRPTIPGGPGPTVYPFVSISFIVSLGLYAEDHQDAVEGDGIMQATVRPLMTAHKLASHRCCLRC